MQRSSTRFESTQTSITVLFPQLNIKQTPLFTLIFLSSIVRSSKTLPSKSINTIPSNITQWSVSATRTNLYLIQ
jgi:hypothetical protein